MKGNSIIYQIFLRSATKDGTLKSAEKLLPHIKDLGMDIAYLSPMYEMDGDEREEFWSDRQKACGFKNPKNPYRMKDYFKVDPEYGTDEDLKSFVDTAHNLGLKVMLDLVYFHCGPNAVLIGKNKDFIKRLPDGTPDYGEWHFPTLNFDCPELCEYLWRNMEYWIENFDIDGYRCDVGDGIPLSFWEEGCKRVRALKPDFLMINEGVKNDFISSGIFDANYWLWGFECATDDVNGALRNITDLSKRVICYENHDTVSDAYDNRLESRYGNEICDAMLVVTFTSGAVPFIYNGTEIADSARHSLWSNRFYGNNLCVDWSEAVTEKGRKRTELIKKLSSIYHNIPAINKGSTEILSDSKTVAAYRKSYNGHEVIVAANLSKNIADITLDMIDEKNFKTLLSARSIRQGNKIILDNGGYTVLYK